MAWVYLFAAGICEIVWATGLKLYGFTLTRGGAFTVFMMLLSFILLDQAMKRLPLGTSYAIWTGIGAVGAAIIGIVRFNEPRDWPRVICIALIVIGIVGLKLLHREPVSPVAGATDSPAATADRVAASTQQDVVR